MVTLTMKSVDIDDYDVKFTMSVVRFLILLQPKNIVNFDTRCRILSDVLANIGTIYRHRILCRRRWRRILAVSCKRSVQSQIVDGMVPRPAGMTEVLETIDSSAEEWSRINVTLTTHWVFQVRIDLNLNRRKNNIERGSPIWYAHQKEIRDAPIKISNFSNFGSIISEHSNTI